MVNVAILGYGTIGSGVKEVIETNNKKLVKHIGDDIRVKYVLDLRDFPGDPVEKILVHDYNEIVSDPQVDIVVEAMGGVEPAYTFVKQALEAGKSVATSNKALVAEKGAQLLKIAQDKNVNFQFEASVGGGIPIIRPLNCCLTADVIEEITGILNGTTNYMMTKMYFEGSEYADVLKEAQAKGYAEADPTADVEGYDACRKIAILTSLVAGQQVNFEHIHTEGISKITATDIKYAKAMGRAIKLLATSKKIGDSYMAIVAPRLLKEDHPLYGVNDVFNAVFVHGNMLGDGMFYGSGAGKLPTASAVVADVVELATNLNRHLYVEWDEKELELVDYKQSSSRFFVRTTQDKEAVEKAFGKVEYIQAEGVTGEIGFLTEEMTEAEYDNKVQGLNVVQMIRA
ncbi:homoserine dehydrogenase [Eubacterium oxidoreducens]|uniref:Homoserine dehydrogenase n=1 Tax=Eubacterium oxidoreducens TaxID=1732 RepID=A0A1G6CKI5_EUBOX|nr:homoserine dehydrogenase [Eubacterium oxidoreducens]SDB33418.1 homoserine dehydrogenase [Eubacterium oxidoreducens]